MIFIGNTIARALLVIGVGKVLSSLLVATSTPYAIMLPMNIISTHVLLHTYVLVCVDCNDIHRQHNLYSYVCANWSLVMIFIGNTTCIAKVAHPRVNIVACCIVMIFMGKTTCIAMLTRAL